jgi:hypothetical protein
VLLVQRVDEKETGAELCTERRGIVPSDRQAAAPFGTIRRESGHDDRAARFDRMTQTLEVLCAVAWVRQEMKDGPVVPQIDRVRMPLGCDVRFYPAYACVRITESSLRSRERRSGHVQDRHAPRAAFEQPIHEAGIPASDIDDSGGRRESRRVDQAKRERGFGLIPAHFG